MKAGSRFRKCVQQFLAEERAATAIEYALIASMMSIAIAGVAMSLGSTLSNDYYGRVDAALPG